MDPMNRRSRPLARLLPILGLLLALATALSPLVQTALAQEDSTGVTGDFGVTIPNDRAPKGLPNSPMLIGSWHIAFNADGSYMAERLDLGPLINGTWEIDGDTLTITDVEGRLSCTEAGTTGDASLDFSTGTYTFERSESGLTLTPQEDGCQMRTVLLSTFELSPFTGCPIPPAGLESAIGATPIAEPPSPEVADAPVEEQIDHFLEQLTACWLTGDANRFLPMLTDDFQREFLSGGTEDVATASEQARALASAMGVPLIFERAGDVRQVRDGEVTCIVRTELAGQESFARFRFILQEDGNWRWDGPA